MPASDRRQKIEAMLRDEPEDTFLRYSMALEMAGDGETDEALRWLERLCQDNPPYVPAYFRAAQISADLERIAQAREHLRHGIDEARRQGDAHAAAEMSEMLADLGDWRGE